MWSTETRQKGLSPRRGKCITVLDTVITTQRQPMLQGIPVRQLECAQPYKIPNCFEFCEHVLTAGKIKIVLVLRIDSVRINGGQPWMMSDSQCCMNLISLGS